MARQDLPVEFGLMYKCIGRAMIAHSRVTFVLTGAGKVTQLLSGILPDKPYTFIGRAFPLICKGLVE